MMVEGIFSRPRYEALSLDPRGRGHLLVTDHAEVPDGQLAAERPQIETWTVAHDSRPIPGPTVVGGARQPARTFRSNAHLLSVLKRRLGEEHVGFRLYAVGSEPFLWDVAALARDFGLGEGECFVAHAGTLRRRVFCVHCKAMTEGVTTNIATCAGCGCQMLVRDHFSRRLSAFMGVQIDAEAPGEVPPVEEIFP